MRMLMSASALRLSTLRQWQAAGALGSKALLSLYGLYKQGTEGPLHRRTPQLLLPDGALKVVRRLSPSR